MIVRILLFSMFLVGSFMSLRVVTCLDALAHGATPSEVGVMMALLALFPVFLAVPCGRWVDIRGFHRPVIVTVVLLTAASATPVLFSPDDFGMYPLYACCATAGLAEMVIHINASYLVGVCSSSKNRTKYFAWNSMSSSIMGLSTPVLAGHLIDGVGFVSAYAAAILMVGMAVALYAASYGRLKVMPLPKPRQYSRHAYDLLKNRGMRRALIVSAVVSMAWNLETFMFPVYGTSVGLDASEIGWLVGVFYAATFAVRLVQSALTRMLREWQFLAASLFVTASAYALFPNFSSMTPLLVIAAMLGFGLGVANPSIMSVVQTTAPVGRAAEAFGIRAVISNGTHVALPLAYGSILAAISVVSLFYICAALMGTTVLMAVRADREDHSTKFQADPENS